MNHQREKARVRATPAWKSLKATVRASQGGLDALTGKPLRPGANLHHMDLRPENYAKLDPKYFKYMNRKSHDALHFIYSYYKRDPQIVFRLQSLLYEMKEAENADRREA